MAEKFWTHLKLKNGDTVKFVPPAPNGEQLGGITQREREEISELKSDIADHEERIETLERGGAGGGVYVVTQEEYDLIEDA